jgi:hypothetical protein
MANATSAARSPMNAVRDMKIVHAREARIIASCASGKERFSLREGWGEWKETYETPDEGDEGESTGDGVEDLDLGEVVEDAGAEVDAGERRVSMRIFVEWIAVSYQVENGDDVSMTPSTMPPLSFTSTSPRNPQHHQSKKKEVLTQDPKDSSSNHNPTLPYCTAIPHHRHSHSTPKYHIGSPMNWRML